MIPIVLSLQNKLDQANNKVLEEIRKLNNNFSNLESKLSVTKQINYFFLHRLVNIEHHCQANVEYSRRECLDIIDIPSEVEADILEEKAADIFEKLGCNILSNGTEAYDRVSKKSATVIKIKMEDVDLPSQNKFLIDKNLCPYY